MQLLFRIVNLLDDIEIKQYLHGSLSPAYRKIVLGEKSVPAGDHVPVHVTGRVGTTTFEGVDFIRVIH